MTLSKTGYHDPMTQARIEAAREHHTFPDERRQTAIENERFRGEYPCGHRHTPNGAKRCRA